MRATESEGVELDSYRLKKVSYSWFEMWEESHEEGSPPTRWSALIDAFMDHLLLAETTAARAAEFESLKQGSINSREYHMEFGRLSKYVIHILPTMEAIVRRFVQGLNPLVINEASTTALNFDINYGKMAAFAKATEDCKLKNTREREGSSKARAAGNLGGSSGGGRSAFRRRSSRPSQSFTQSSMSAPPSGPRYGKANIVVDSLSRKSKSSLAHLAAYQKSLAKEVHRLASLGVRLADSTEGGVIVQNRLESLVVEVKEK
ncbi:uncharacterized protein [Nicotiana tomentosiformis]|uniref:uncharacterized protein n=1 Tax=Nicotiana tomentosiformis TaxID=4098 RepID=UPI00388CE07A